MLYVVTPTYNRAALLKRLYDSLIRQTENSFIWYIIDDGSTDDTKSVIQNSMKENIINVKYRYKPNGGKHTAINLAVKDLQDDDLVFIVDSDDYLTCDAIETINKFHSKYQEEKLLAGFSFLRQHSDGKKICNKSLDKEEFVSDFIKERVNKNISGDMAEVWYAFALKEFPFPEYPDEKYVPEDAVWIPMARKYKLVFVNKVIYICDYLPGGLTDSWRILKLRSPRSAAERCYQYTFKDCSMKARIKGEVGRIVYSKYAGAKLSEIYVKSNSKYLCILTYFPALFICEYKKYYNKLGIKNGKS